MRTFRPDPVVRDLLDSRALEKSRPRSFCDPSTAPAGGPPIPAVTCLSGALEATRVDDGADLPASPASHASQEPSKPPGSVLPLLHAAEKRVARGADDRLPGRDILDLDCPPAIRAIDDPGYTRAVLNPGRSRRIRDPPGRIPRATRGADEAVFDRAHLARVAAGPAFGVFGPPRRGGIRRHHPRGDKVVHRSREVAATSRTRVTTGRGLVGGPATRRAGQHERTPGVLPRQL